MTDALFETPTAGAPVPVAGQPSAAAHALGAAAEAHAGPVGGEARRVPAGPVIAIHVVGLPTPQGSKRGFVVGGRAIVVDDNKPKLRSWRQDVKQATVDATELLALPDPWQPIVGPVELDITFLMPRPRSHYRTGRNAHLLRDTAPTRPATKPDVDKLLRSTLDALTGLLYRDDAQVVGLTGRKHYTTGHTGALIQVYAGGPA